MRAVDFIAGNKEQLEQLHAMGIRIATMADGRVQLLHTASEVSVRPGFLWSLKVFENGGGGGGLSTTFKALKVGEKLMNNSRLKHINDSKEHYLLGFLFQIFFFFFLNE